MAMDKINNLSEVDIMQVATKGREIATKQGKELNQATDYIVLGAMAYLTRDNDIDLLDDLQQIVDERVNDYATKAKLLDFNNKNWNIIKEFSNAAGQKELKALALYWDPAELNRHDFGIATPQDISRLAAKVLDLHAEDILAEYCAGIGGFLSVATAENTVEKAVGIELNKDSQVIANIRAFIINDSFAVKQGDVLTEDFQELEANKIFSHPPFNLRSVGTYEKILPWLKEKVAGHRPSQRLDWEFTLSPVYSQREGGKTVVLVADGMLFSVGRDAMIRKRLAEEGRLEAVISLPAGILSGSGIRVNLLVFSEDNKHFNMIDARDMGEKTKWRTKLSRDDIDQIVSWYESQSDSEHNKLIDLAQMEVNDYSWVPSAYFRESLPVLENPETLGNLAEVGRGANLKSSQLEGWASVEPTEYQYIMLKHIDDNGVSEDLPYLKEIDERSQRFLLKAGDLLITRTAPFKVTIMPKTKSKVLANGNLYYLRFKSEKVNPVYAMLYLNSERGKRALDAFSKGMTLNMLSRRDLENIEIPVIPMDKQQEMVTAYQKLAQELKELKAQEEKVMDKMTALVNG